ncbi:unnamed protein product [Rhizophagus irregularis]|nr:unnamed protein product [Rhizophagus irregularis]
MDVHGRGPRRDLVLYHMQEELLESDYIHNNEHIFQKNPVALERWILHTIAENFELSHNPDARQRLPHGSASRFTICGNLPTLR